MGRACQAEQFACVAGALEYELQAVFAEVADDFFDARCGHARPSAKLVSCNGIDARWVRHDGLRLRFVPRRSVYARRPALALPCLVQRED